MKLIKFLTDNNLKLSESEATTDTSWNTRIAARAVILDSEGKIALMYVAEYDIYKLPGGGIDENESLDEALNREIKEETGCDIEVDSLIGMVIEKRDQWKLFQVSHCFKTKLKSKGEQNLTKEEKETGFSLYWANDLDEAIKLVKSGKSDRYDDIYIKNRDSSILEELKSNKDN